MRNLRPRAHLTTEEHSSPFENMESLEMNDAFMVSIDQRTFLRQSSKTTKNSSGDDLQVGGVQVMYRWVVPHRPLLVALPDLEGVLQDGVHDPPDAEGRLDHVGDHLLHCNTKTPLLRLLHVGDHLLHCNTKTPLLWLLRLLVTMVTTITSYYGYYGLLAGLLLLLLLLTVKSLLEPLDADHVLGQPERLPRRLDGELTARQTHALVNPRRPYTTSPINPITIHCSTGLHRTGGFA